MPSRLDDRAAHLSSVTSCHSIQPVSCERRVELPPSNCPIFGSSADRCNAELAAAVRRSSRQSRSLTRSPNVSSPRRSRQRPHPAASTGIPRRIGEILPIFVARFDGRGYTRSVRSGVASRIQGRLSMGNRIFVAVVLLLWASTMSWLVVEKILPPFFSGEPPTHGVAPGKAAGVLGDRMCRPARRLRGPPGRAGCPVVDGNPQPGAARRTFRSRKWPRSG